MFVKIDTRPDFRILRPEISQLHENMTGEVKAIILENMGTPPNHIILEMDEVSVFDSRLIGMFWEIQSLAHQKGYSFYLCGIKDSLSGELNKIPSFKNLNKVPTLAEAIDMVMMEKLEREFMEGEE